MWFFEMNIPDSRIVEIFSRVCFVFFFSKEDFFIFKEDAHWKCAGGTIFLMVKWSKWKANGNKAVPFYGTFNSYSEKLRATCHVEFYKYEWCRGTCQYIHEYVKKRRFI